MARKVNFGLWYDFRNPAPWTVPFESLYADVLEQIVGAEQLGFDSVWLTEHHFCDDGYTPSPLVIAAAIGARTRRMRIATNLMILPMHDPVRIAEDSATLAILTGGRFDLGIGVGYRELEFKQFGRELKHRPSLIEEGVAILRRAWSGEKLNFAGKRFSVGDFRITPVPPHAPRILIGGMTAPAIERAALIGDGFLSTGGIGQDLYVDAIAKQGAAKKGRIFAGNWTIVTEDPERELARVGPHVLYQSNEYIRWGAFGPPDQVPLFPDAASAVANGLCRIVDVETAVRTLTELLKQYPMIEDVHFWAQFPGEPLASGQRRIELLAHKVLPRVRAALAA